MSSIIRGSDNFDSAGPTTYISPPQTITSSGTVVLPHGLGGTPARVFGTLRCVVADNNWDVGDEFQAPMTQESGSTSDSYGVVLQKDATDVTLLFGSAPTVFLGMNKTSRIGVQLTNSSWVYIVQAELK